MSLRMFQRLGEQCQSDFKDYENIPQSPIVEKLNQEIKRTASVLPERILVQLDKFSIFHDAFLKGYSWVAWIDADMVVHPQAENMFCESLSKNSVYFGSRNAPETEFKIRFRKSLNNKYTEVFDIYGNTGHVVMHRESWNKLYQTIMDLDFSAYVDDFEKFLNAGADQAVLALAVNIAGIEQGFHLQDWKKKYLYHVTGLQLPKYLRIERSALRLVPEAGNILKRVAIADMLLKIENNRTLSWFKGVDG